MPLTPITAPWKEIAEYQNIKSKLLPGSVQLLVGLTGLPRAVWTAAIFEEIKSPVMVVTPTPEAARIFYENLVAVKPGDQVLYFPPVELLPYEVRARNTEIERQRISTLTKLSQKEPVLVVAPLQSLMRKTIPPNVFFKFVLTLSVGRRVNLSQLTSTLINIGYTKEYMVEVPGTFSTRGGIIDIFPYTEEYPFRIELFDDEIDSIRNFDLATQRSLQEKQTAVITPARELPAEAGTLLKAGENLSQELEKVLLSYSAIKRRHLRDSFSPYIEQMREGLWNEGMEQFLLHIYPDAASPLEYLSDQGLVILDEPDRITQEAETVLVENHSLYFDLLEDGKILPSFAENFQTEATYKEVLAKRPMLLFSHLPEDGGFDLTNKYYIPTRELPSYKGNFPRLKEDLKFYLEQGYRVVVSASSSIRVNKMKELLFDLGAERAEVIHAGFSRGFECAAIKMLLFSETDILGQTIQTKSRRRSRKGEKIATFLDLKEGDYVVHANHGIGRYLGVKRLQIGDAQRDYLYIQYSGEDKLYVPTDQVDLIQKYIGDEGHAPKLYKLGGNEWNRVKNKVRHSVQDMAKELLALYAAREAVRGHAFSPDIVWQQEFEDSFPYPETLDQLRAVEEIKKDMERQKPMDRLLCGDVGYGKTEVALRAAFKAIMDGKQVALLVPTTVLAEQHQRTFQERFNGFPIKVGVLSRFKSAKAVTQTLNGLTQGTVDIVIGTHRLLSNDVKFKDLGLLIIDEEQRFGVAHKEKIKGLKQNVDVLTLSATPIPRTLHMSLLGVRDMSVIETPPEDRQPVQTYVMEFQERVIKEAIMRELLRGGQIYFVHNRVNNIDLIANHIMELVPEAKVLVAHGQMREHDLEMIMLDFIEGKGNVLICTTIIESGLDISNVNTLIVDEADRFGLSQLYQLRGRVGRSERQAYAYFTYRKEKILSDVAKKRLTAIRDFTELGSGFKIAMRDLEIRGAGNILGPEQHGHILAVGFDMYCRLVQEEVDKQRYGEEFVPEKISPQLELNLDAFIPDAYVSDTELKIELYKRLASAIDISEVKDLELEAEDRYGVAPEPVRNLFRLGLIKVLAEKLGVSSIAQQKGFVHIRFASGRQISGTVLAELVREFNRRISFGAAVDLEIKIKAVGEKPQRILDIVIKLFEKLIDLTDKESRDIMELS